MATQIYAKTLSGDVATLNFNVSDTIASLKAQIIADGIPGNGLELITNTWEKLDDAKLVSDYNLSNESTLRIIHNVNANITIFVENTKGDKITLTVEPRDTIANIKNKISETQLSFTNEELVYDGTILDNTYSLAYYKIKHQSVLRLVNLITIHVKTLTSQVVTINCDPQEAVSDVVSKIHNKGIPVDGLQLITEDWKQLEDGKTLSDYDITNSSVLRVAYCGMKIYISTPSGILHDLRVNPSTTISDVKGKVAEILNVAIDQIALTTDVKRALDDDALTLADCDVKSDATLFLVREKMVMHVRVIIKMGGLASIKPLSLEAVPFDKVCDLKGQIEQQEGIPTNLQSLYFQGCNIKDSMTLIQAKITNNCTVNLKLLPMTIIIKSADRADVTFQERASQSIEYIKAKAIHYDPNLPSLKNFSLKYGEKLLDDCSSLSEHGIYKHCILMMVINESAPENIKSDSAAQPMRIFVLTMSGETHTLQMKLSDTIYSVKFKMSDIEGIHVDRQRIIFGGEQLRNTRTLAEYNIQADATLELVLKLCSC